MRQGRNMATCGMGSERRVADEESTMEGCILWCICLAQQPELGGTSPWVVCGRVSDASWTHDARQGGWG